MSSTESVSQWIAQLKDRDDEAARQVYHRYVELLKALARKKLGAIPRRVEDEEDVALVAMHSLLQGIPEGRFHDLNDRDDLWQVLVMLVERKAINQRRRVLSRKRGAGRVRGESKLNPLDRSNRDGIDQLPACEPSPQYAAELVEQLSCRMNQLEDDGLRQIAVWKMEGRTNDEIARLRGCTVRTVERKLRLIRRTWADVFLS